LLKILLKNTRHSAPLNALSIGSLRQILKKIQPQTANKFVIAATNRLTNAQPAENHDELSESTLNSGNNFNL
jgi:hypothetical protein